MEITAERPSMAQEGLSSSYNVTPFTPTHHFRNGILSFTEIFLSNVEEWSKPITTLPPPPPPITFSGSDRFIKGRLPHRTLAISASLSSLFDEAMPTLPDVCKRGDVHADKAIVKTQKTTQDEMHGSDDRARAASTQFNPSIHTDNVQNSDKSDANVQVLSSNGMVDISACSTDNFLEVKATCPQDGCLQSANDSADVATSDTYKLLRDATQHAHGSDDAMFQFLFKDDERVQPLDEAGLSEGFDCILSTTKELEGSLCVTDKILSGLHMKNDGGGNIATKMLVDAVVGHALPLECESSLPFPSPILRCDDADGVAELPLPSLLMSLNDNKSIGHTGGAPELSPTKCHKDNNLTNSLPSSSKCSDENNKADTSAVSELFLPSLTKRCHVYTSVGDVDVVTELPLPSVLNSLENVTQSTEGLSQLSLPSPRKSNNANSLTSNVEGVAESQLQPLPMSLDVNALQSRVMEAPIVLQQDEQVQDLEEGELSERLSNDECLEMAEEVMTHEECESQLLNDNPVESKVTESSTDDEMNQPISLFISRYRTRSSVNPSARKMPPLDMDSNIKTKVKAGNKRKFEEQEQLPREIIGTDMAGKVQLRQVKGGQKRPSKVARVLNNNSGGGLLGVANKLSAVSKIGMDEAKGDADNQHQELTAGRARRDQVMGTPAVALCEKEDGASCTRSKGLTQHGLAGREHDFAPEKNTVCLPMVLEEGLSTVDAGNDHKSSQAKVATTKEKRILTAERKKKRQLKKHRKAYERGVGKIRVKPCIEKQKEKKTCHFYARGRCDKGVSCPFPHDITPITKSEICKYFINNCCLKGDDCPYSHALSTFPCKYFHTRGKCMEGDSCRFSHEPISEEAKQQLLAKIEQEQQVREGKKAMDRDSLGRINSKHSVLPSDLELFPLGGKRGNRTPLKVTDAAASKIPRLDKTGTGSVSNNIGKISMLGVAKKAASTFIGGDTGVNTANLEVNKSMLRGNLLDPTGILADRSSAICTTKSVTRETGLPLMQTTGFSRHSITTQERKTNVGAFLQEQLDTSHLMRKSKLGMGSESYGGCYTLLNQPRALSMGQTSLLKAPNTSAPGDLNAKAMMGLPHASVDHSHLTPTSTPTICAGNRPKSDFSMNEGKGVLNEDSVRIDATVTNPSVLGPSLLDLVSTPQRATFSKAPMASTSGLLSPTINATPKRSIASAFLDRFLKA